MLRETDLNPAKGKLYAHPPTPMQQAHKADLVRELVKVSPFFASNLRLVGLIPPHYILESG